MALSRDAILSADDLLREEVPVPEWGGTVFVRVMTARERDRFEQKWSESRYDNIRAFLAVCVVCDDEGLPLFSEKDVDALGRKSAAALDRIFEVASRVNKLTPQDIEDLEGNSDASRSEGSVSASHCL